MTIRQFDIFLINFNPAKGTMPGKIRPAIIVQSDILNNIKHPSTLVVPLSSLSYGKRTTMLRIEIEPDSTNGLQKTSYAIIDQLTAVDNNKFIEKVGSLDEIYHQQISHALLAVLNLL